MRTLMAAFLAASFLGLVRPSHAAGKMRTQSVPRGWPSDKKVKARDAVKQIRSAKKPGLAYIFPYKIDTKNSALNREASAFRSFCGKIPSDKMLLKKMKDDFVVFAAKKSANALSGTGIKCRNFAIVILDERAKGIWVWEQPPASLRQFKGYLFNVQQLIKRQRAVQAAAKAKREAQQKKEDAAEKAKREAAERAKKIPGLLSENKTKKRKPLRKQKPQEEEEEE